MPQIRSGLWLLLDNLSAAVFAFVFFVITARLLTPLEFGVGALALSLAQIATPMVESLFHDALIQREQLEERHIRTAATASVIAAIVLAAIFWLAASSFAQLLDAPLLAQCLPYMGIALLASGIQTVPAAQARRAMTFRMLAIRTVSARTIATIVGVVLAVSGAGVWSIVVQFILSATLAALFLTISVKPDLRPMLDRAALREMLPFAVPAVGTQVLVFANSRVVTVIIGAVMGPIAAGTWNVALRFVEPVQVLAATTIGQLTLPLLSRQQTNRPALAGIFTLGSRRSNLILVPMFVGLAMCAEPVLVLFVGAQWLSAVPVMAIICLVMAVLMARQLAEIVFIAIGAPKFNFWLQAGASALSFVGVLFGARYGIVAAALGWATRVLPFVTVAPKLLQRTAGIPIYQQLSVAAAPFLASGVMALALWGLQETAILPAAIVPALILLIAAGAAVYGAAIWLCDPSLRDDARAIRAALPGRRAR